jgi:hypothetical protein
MSMSPAHPNRDDYTPRLVGQITYGNTGIFGKYAAVESASSMDWAVASKMYWVLLGTKN